MQRRALMVWKQDQSYGRKESARANTHTHNKYHHQGPSPPVSVVGTGALLVEQTPRRIGLARHLWAACARRMGTIVLFAAMIAHRTGRRRLLRGDRATSCTGLALLLLQQTLFALAFGKFVKLHAAPSHVRSRLTSGGRSSRRSLLSLGREILGENRRQLKRQRRRIGGLALHDPLAPCHHVESIAEMGHDGAGEKDAVLLRGLGVDSRS